LSKPNSTINNLLGQIKDKKTNPLKRAYLIDKLTSQKNLNKKELAYLINKSPSYISNYLRLVNLPEVIKDALLSEIISEGHARALTFVSSHTESLQLFEDIIRYSYSVRETERRVDKIRQFKRHYGQVSEELKNEAEKLRAKWGLEVKISRQKRQISLKMNFPLGVIGLGKLRKVFRRLLS
jgi:ParB family transcriptional regulator, chromosome partitioning protein